MRFLGLGFEDTVADAKTIWLYREHLTQVRAIDALFARFDKHLNEAGYLAMGGQIVDASIVAAPKQRNSDDEKRDIKEGRIPQAWNDKPAKLRQKDRDARWTVKRGRKKEGSAVEIAVPEFGYKNHINTDRHHGLIRKWTLSDAAAHDGHRLTDLLDKTNTASCVWADTAYRSGKNERRIAKAGLFSKVHFKKPKGKSLPGKLAKANAARSKVRAHIEHVFATQKHRMDLFIRTIGIDRARTKIGMANLVYNFKRTLWLEERRAPV